MSVKVRMTRTGTRNKVAFRVVATDSRSARDGGFIENLGWYNPESKTGNCQLKLDRIKYWAGKGATLSATVRSLVKRAEKGAGA